MKLKRTQFVCRFAGLALLTCLTACGGGGGSSSGGSGSPPPQLTIATQSTLPAALQNHAYTATLVATGGKGSLTWSIAAISSTTLFVDGLTIDASTGIISGTAKFQGTGGFTAQVTDSASHTASQNFTITASVPLQAAVPQTFTLQEFNNSGVPIPANSVVTGGVEPLSFALNSPCLPPGERIDSTTGFVTGSASTIGTFICGMTVRDSFSPPESVVGQFTINVSAPPLSMATNSLPQKILLNRPFSGKVIATGGVPPYHFTLASGAVVPPGLSTVDPSGGQISGTPTTLGFYNFTVNVSDASSPAQTSTGTYNITVVSSIGRNDTVATATPITNGTITASISPYIDPPGNTPLAADNDYYKLVSLGGSTVHIETQAQRWWPGDPVDTVIEIVDASNARYSTCRQPGDTSTTFASVCVNDDIASNPSTPDSALDFQVPGTANAATTFYVHVLDWKGNARPDMMYALQVSGANAPLTIDPLPLLSASRGVSYSQTLTAANGAGSIVWTISSGNLPPGLAISSSAISGTATTDGNYSFTLKATDSGTPAQTATAQKVIRVVEPVKITSSPNLPDACLNQPYSFAAQASGGIAPYGWSFISNNWIGVIGIDQSTGVFSGVPITFPGTFMGTLGVTDGTGHTDFQQVTLTLKQCP